MVREGESKRERQGSGNVNPSSEPSLTCHQKNCKLHNNKKQTAKLEAFLAQRARTDLELLPIVRGALRDTTTVLRRARFGMGAISFAVGAARAGAAVQYALAVRALEAAERRGGGGAAAEEARLRQLERLQELARRRTW